MDGWDRHCTVLVWVRMTWELTAWRYCCRRWLVGTGQVGFGSWCLWRVSFMKLSILYISMERSMLNSLLSASTSDIEASGDRHLLQPSILLPSFAGFFSTPAAHGCDLDSLGSRAIDPFDPSCSTLRLAPHNHLIIARLVGVIIAEPSMVQVMDPPPMGLYKPRPSSWFTVRRLGLLFLYS